MKKTNSKKRYVCEKTLFANKVYDGTFHLDTYLKGEVDHYTYNGIPLRINFYITKNSNNKLTQENGLLDLIIPIIPACYDMKSVRSLSEFISQAKDQQTIKNKVQSVNRAGLDKRINQYAEKILIYIKNEIAIRYAIAKQNNDTKTMQLLSNLSVMNDFDLELYSLLLKQPTQIIESKSDLPTQDNNYKLIYADGTIVPITKKQYRSINSYSYNYNRYVKIAEKFYSLSKVLSDYENYDISRELHESTVPTHSVIARGYSRKTNNRVKKPTMLENAKTPNKKKSKSQKPSQPTND